MFMNIGILGIGKLGLCFGLNLEQCGYTITGVDVHEDYVRALNNKSFFSYEPKVNELLAKSTKFRATVAISDVLNDDTTILFVMVATPSLQTGAYDHSQIERVAEELIAFGKRNQTVHLVIGCTVMPGYCATLQAKLSEYNYTVTYNPEFIAQGNIIHDQLYPDQILIGEGSEDAGTVLTEIYGRLCRSQPTICRMDPLSAEICKIATNCFLTTKISFANSVGDLAVKAGANPEKILQAIGADSRIGHKYLQYGDGFGGPCFPRDNRALNLFAQQTDYRLLIGEATDEVNRQHLQFLFDQAMQTPEAITFDEVTYKKGTVILDESQRLALVIQLAKAGKRVIIIEKQAVINELKLRHGDLFTYRVKSIE
jgi:UDPglucose 6-dehydrogenase